MSLTHLVLFKFWTGASEVALTAALLDESHLQGGLQPLAGGID